MVRWKTGTAALLALLFLARAAAGQAWETPGFDVGDRCPDVALYDTRGNLVRLSDFQGRIVVLQMFATW